MIRRLARCIREYKWAALLSPLCMVGEVFMETRIPRVLSRIVDLGVTLGDMGAVIRYGLLLVLFSICSLCFSSPISSSFLTSLLLYTSSAFKTAMSISLIFAFF